MTNRKEEFETRLDDVRARVAGFFDTNPAEWSAEQDEAFTEFVRQSPEADVTELAAAFGQVAGFQPSVSGDPAGAAARAFGITPEDAVDANEGLLALLEQLGLTGGDFQTLQDFSGFGLGADDATDALRAQFGLPSAGDVERAERGLDIAGINAATGRINAIVNQELATAQILLDQDMFEAAEVHLDRADALNKFSAAFVPLEFDLGARQVALQEGGVITDAFNALTSELSTRGQLEGVAGTGFTNLVSVLGNLAAEQQRLGLDILRTPRNAIPAFLLGLGQEPGFEQFDVRRLLGIDPAGLQDVINQAISSFQGVRDVAGEPFTAGGEPFDLVKKIEELRTGAAGAATDVPQLADFLPADVEAGQIDDGALPPVAPVEEPATAPVTINVGGGGGAAQPAPQPTEDIGGLDQILRLIQGREFTR